MNKVVQTEERLIVPVYWKRPLEITRGRDVYLYDQDGKEYLDLTSNYGVAITGHCHPRVVSAIQRQAEELISCHGTYYNKVRSDYLEKLGEIAPPTLKKAYLSNSGTESVEFALKLARKATGRKNFVAMMNGFHGKTLGSLSATWKKKYREPFLPLVPGFTHVPYGKIDRVEQAVDENTAAVIAEPIQGESGIIVPPSDYLPALRELCDRQGVLLILDEIQTGLGRTGKEFACKHWGIEPDIMCLSKAVASGLPMGVTLATDDVAGKLQVGDHSSTFGGGPVACAAGKATLEVIAEERLTENAERVGAYLKQKLESLQEKHSSIREVRGMGLMIGVEFRFDVLDVIMRCIEEQLLFLDAGRTVLRMLPPLTLKKEHADAAVSILDEVLGEIEAEKIRG